MPWGKLDDKFHRNPKVRALRRKRGGRSALGTWVFWWSWCLDGVELDGVVPEIELDKGELDSVSLLVEVGLWERVDGGYRFHDFHEYNPTAAQVLAKRKADRERVAANRHATRSGHQSESRESLPRVASTRDPLPSPPVPDQKKENAPTPTPELWANRDRRWICSERIWSDICARAGRPWHGMATARDREAFAVIAEHAVAANPAAPSDVARTALEAFSGDATQEPHGWDVSWCAGHVAVYASGRTPPRKGAPVAVIAPRLSPARARVEAARAAEHAVRMNDDSTPEELAAATKELHAAQAAVRAEARA